ncbi:MAG TPA: serine hydrolase domain-containing protein, partial [Kofleriaceae bacterium]|nr:serine hydrolase domain-containing protein [Kofleriaceae bacterium]
MVRRLTLFAALLAAACGGSPPRRAPSGPSPDADPEGPHRELVAAAVRPYLDAELISGVAIGLLDAGRREIYGFGKGPGGAVPDGRSLFELGSITKVYTGLLLADAIQRREVELDAPVTDYLPPGVSVPTRDRTAITIRHLALHSAGLPPLPPSAASLPPGDPFGRYDEDALYRDLAQTELAFAPGARIQSSNYGTGLLGFAIGRKLGTGYQKALEARILAPLELHDTYFTVPAAVAPRRLVGTDDELAAVPHWTWDALAAAGALSSTVRDQLRLLEAELDAAAGG